MIFGTREVPNKKKKKSSFQCQPVFKIFYTFYCISVRRIRIIKNIPIPIFFTTYYRLTILRLICWLIIYIRTYHKKRIINYAIDDVATIKDSNLLRVDWVNNNYRLSRVPRIGRFSRKTIRRRNYRKKKKTEQKCPMLRRARLKQCTDESFISSV